jgi:hypothetical protein
MVRILADHNVERHVQVLVSICLSPEWADVWAALECQVDAVVPVWNTAAGGEKLFVGMTHARKGSRRTKKRVEL